MAMGSEIMTWYRGSWHRGDAPIMSAADHGSWQGTNVFDGARMFDGLAPDLDRHCARINRSAEAMMITPTVPAEEMVALVRRHPNLHLDTSAHRGRYLGQPGSGWEMLMQFGNTLIQDKVLVGLSAGLVGQSHETLIQEYMALPLKDSVKEKWLYTNAARVFRVA